MSLKKFKELAEPIPKEKIILPLKHELFVKELIKQGGNQTKAYAKAYNKDTNSPKELSTSRSNASDLLTKPNIRKRVVQALEESNLTVERLSKKLNAFVDSENEGIGLEATKTAFKLHDAFPSEKQDVDSQDNSLQIVFAKVVINKDKKV